MRKWLSGIFFLISFITVFSQEESARKIKGLSTEIVYDLYTDSKGFLWAAHSQGVSRYDGHAFTHFESPDQSPIDVTNICEDMQGRIWVHDFTGQIFYIENEKMNLFEPYIAQNEKTFPAMVIVDSELVITSSSGLFVLNTGSFKGQYLNTPLGKASSNSLAVCGNTVIAYNRHEAFKYQPGKGLINIPVVPMNGIAFNKTNKSFMLAPFRTKDTVYAHNNESGDFFTFIERNDSLLIITKEKTLGIVNTIINCAGTIWINTKKASYTRDYKKKIVNQNITDIVQDKEGNRWYGSLQEGLAMVPADKGWERKSLPFLPKNDFIRCMFTQNDQIIYGTQSGKIIVLQNNQLVAELFLPAKAGSVEHIFILPNKRLLIAPSIGLYFANIEQKKIFKITSVETVKGLAITDSTFLLARATDLSKISITPTIKKYLNAGPLLPGDEEKQVALFGNWINNTRKAVESTRCYLVSFDNKSKKTFAVFKNGLAIVNNDSVHYILFENKPIKASCLIQENGAAYAGSLNKGVFVYTDSVVEMISKKEGLVSNTILKMKIFEGLLYLVEPKCLQVWDIHQKKLVTTIPLPNENEGTVYDFLQKNGVVHLTFTNTLYNLALSDIQVKSPPVAYLLSAKTSRRGENVTDNTVLPYYENTIQINLSSPSYVYPEATYFMYRLYDVYDTTWKKIDGPVYDISFTSLKPGNYYFEAYTV